MTGERSRGSEYGAPMAHTADTTALDGVATAELIAEGHARATEIVEDAIERATRLNPDLNAIIHPLYDQAREAAAAIDAAAPGSGPLAGVPFLTKDLTCATAGDPYHGGNAVLRDIGYTAPHDTYLAVMFRELGLVNLGRTNTPEFGLTATTEPASHGPTRNPWHLDHSTGGSSGGSAAAVAAGIVPIGHANDGGGSIRIPASECGLFGLKPSRGRVSLGPDIGEGWGGAIIEGVVTRSVRDSAVVLDGISRPWPGDPYAAPPPPAPFAHAASSPSPRRRFGLCPHSDWGPVHPDCIAAVEATGALLENLGHEVDISHPASLFDDGFFELFPKVLGVGTATMVDQLGQAIGRAFGPDDFEGDTRALIDLGRRVSGTEYVEAIEWFHDYTRATAAWWDDHDILVTPTLAEPPPRLGELRDPSTGTRRLRELAHFTMQFNVTGQPAMSIPLHQSGDGLPVGVQLVGSMASEYELFQLAGDLERAAPWADRRPGVWAG